MTEYHDTINAVLETGQVPDDDTIKSLINNGIVGAAATGQRRKLGRQLAEIARLVQDGRTESAQDMAEETAETFAQYNQQAAKSVDRTLWDEPGSKTHKPRPDYSAIQPLRALLDHAAGAGEVTDEDIDALVTHDDLTPAQRAEWKQKVKASAARIAKIAQPEPGTWAGGDARREVMTQLDRLSHAMGKPKPPSTDHLSPRELADLINNPHGNGAA